MACHTVNMPFRALKLGYPSVVECELASRMYSETFPLTSRIRFEFPERDGLPPLKFWWYDGNPTDSLSPLRPEAGAIHEIVNMMDTLPGQRRVGHRRQRQTLLARRLRRHVWGVDEGAGELCAG